MKDSAVYLKGTLAVCGIILILLCILNFEILGYIAVQAKGQLKIIFGARPLDEFLAREEITASQKEKLRLIGELKKFASDELGLVDNGCYSKMYYQKEPVYVWLVIASPEFSLETYEWKFPIVGSFSYKGYFNKRDAEKCAERLRAKGYETRIRPASAWSTLGYFKDPVFTSMLDDDEGDLADLIFHEMTHGTVFVKNELQFNENLASFIGEKGAIYYLAKKYGDNSEQLRMYIDSQYDYNLFYEYIIAGAKRLDALYKSFSDSISIDEKRRRKNEMISEIAQGVTELQVREKERFDHFRKFTPNNAYFSSYMTYRSDLSSFENDFAAQGDDLRNYIAWVKMTYRDKNVKKAK